eukprot:TRINITY_DN23814_c0_g1_i1.p1 TRINITY_DN23814_c0_g1~~TRINITY_DN23814_c0_g1_i1.p1  ORF type:complete len:288 (-),score=39.75 TRINITY_DN23814_c0_g1_i1:29-892(-)
MRGPREQESQNFEEALQLYKAVVPLKTDKAESAVKDTAGVLHMLGRSEEGFAFLIEHRHVIRKLEAYENLLKNFTKLWNEEESSTPTCMRTVVLRLEATAAAEGSAASKIGMSRCSHIFRNWARIREVLPLGDCEALVTFASHSAAQKALCNCQGKPGVLEASLQGESLASCLLVFPTGLLLSLSAVLSTSTLCVREPRTCSPRSSTHSSSIFVPSSCNFPQDVTPECPAHRSTTALPSDSTRTSCQAGHSSTGSLTGSSSTDSLTDYSHIKPDSPLHVPYHPPQHP